MTDVIKVSNLTKTFGSNVAVDNISFSVKKGEIFGFLGPNGAGKTTTARMLTGVFPPSSGTVQILGYDMKREPVMAKQKFGVVPETSNAYNDLTAWQNMMLMGEIYGISHKSASARATKLLETLGLSDRKDDKVLTYSKGMKQRLVLAMALIHEPELLFLDEPTSGLDVQSTRLILALLGKLNSEGATIFLTTHNMEEANRLCDRIAIIRSGRLAAIEAPEKLKKRADQINMIEVSFDGEFLIDQISELHGVTGVKRTGDKWQITAENKDTVIRSLVVFSRQQEAEILTLITHAPSLDDVFLKLTGEAEQ